MSTYVGRLKCTRLGVIYKHTHKNTSKKNFQFILQNIYRKSIRKSREVIIYYGS